MTLFTTSRPTISVKSVTRYPTRITTGTGLSYTYDNGTLNISLDYSDIPDSAAIADPSNYTTVVYNKTTGLLEEVQLDYIPTTVVTDPVYTRGDSNFTIPNDYRVLSLVANLTASRTWTLPSAANVTSGDRIFIYDTVGGVSAAYPLVIAAPTGNTINGASSITLSNAFAGITIVSNSGTQWTAILTNVDSVGGLGTNVANALKSAVNSANGVIRLDSSGNVPALNGAALTSLNASNIGSGTVPAARLPGPSLSTIGGVKAKAAETSKFVNQIDTDGSVNLAQPAFSDISGSVAASQLPNPSASTLGGVQSKAAESNKFLTAIGTDGTVSNAQPSASNISGLASSATTDTTNASNITSGTLSASRLPNPSATTLGGVQSKAAISNQFLTQIGTDGVVASAQPAVSNISGLGTDVGTALGVNVGSAGSVVVNGGALGTPSSGTLTNATGLPISTGVSGLGTGVGTFLVTPSSANLASAVTDETGTGALVFANSPTLVTPVLGTPASGNLANCTFPTLNQNTSGTAAGLSSTLVVGSGGTGTGTAFTAGSVVFAGTSGVYSQDNSNFFWDNTNKRLGIGTASPAQIIHVSGGSIRPTFQSTGNGQYCSTRWLAKNSSGGDVQYEYGVGIAADNAWELFDTVNAGLVDRYISGASGYRAFCTNGSERMRIDSVGNLGLAVTPSAWTANVRAQQIGSYFSAYSDAYAAAVSISHNEYRSSDTVSKYLQTGVAAGKYTINGSGVHSWYSAPSGTAGGTITFTQAMTLDASGRLQINTTSGTGRLNVQGTYDGSAPSTSSVPIARFNNGGAISLWAGATAYSYGWLQAIQDDGTNNLKSLYIQPLGADTILNPTSGNVGIGTSSPGDKLTVASTGADVKMQITNATVTAWPGYISGTLFVSGTFTNHPFLFFTNNSEKARIDASGNLLVGTTSATLSSRLSVKSSTTSGGSYNSYFSNSAGTVLLFIRDDGGFSFDTTSAGGPYSYTSAAAANVFIDSSGYLGRSTSSLKYKRDVKDAIHGLADVMKLRSVTFKNKEDDDQRVFGGLIAEEVSAAGLTEFVVYDTKGQPDALHYGNMAGLFVKAIQELAAKVAELEAKI